MQTQTRTWGAARRAGLVPGLAAAVLLASAPAARAQTSVAYRLTFSTDNSNYGELYTPNPFPPYVTLTQNGQLRLVVDTTPDPLQGVFLTLDSFQPAFGGSGNVFVDVADQYSAGLALLIPAVPGISTIYHAFNMTFTDMGTYTLRIRLDSEGHTGAPVTFRVAVMPAGAGATSFAGAWDPSIVYPPNTIVTTGGVFSGFDWWLEANSSGTQSQPGTGFDWYHISGPSSEGPAGPAGDGLMTGSILTLPAAQAAPAGFTLIGSSTLVYLDGANHLRTLAVKYYQKS